MKARNVIAGWPQGTSSSKPYPRNQAWWIPYLGGWSQTDRTKLALEQAMEKEYRDSQNRMMDEWYHTGKVKTPTEHLREFWGSGEMFELKGFDVEPSSAGDVTLEKIQKAYGEAKFGAEADVPDEFRFDGIQYYEPLEDHIAPTYGGITREGNKPYFGSDGTGGSITLKMIQDFFSPERLERERQTEWERRRQQSEMMRPYQGAPINVLGAAYRVMLSNFGAPLHPEEAKRLTKVLEDWRISHEQATDAG